MKTIFSHPDSSPHRALQGAWRSAVLPGITAILVLALQVPAGAQQPDPADPPGSVARLNLIDGNVSFLPADLAGTSDAYAWTPAMANRPLTTGDRLWAGPGARTELHVGSTSVRMNEKTSLDFRTLGDNVTQLRLEQGSLRMRVRTLFEGQRLEIDTPNLAFVINQPGDYRIDANPATDTTRVVAQSGGGAIYGDSGAPLNLGNRQQGSFTGTDLAPATPGASIQDNFDAWASARDQREDQSVSARYIPREIVGYQQLDGYGDWHLDPGYGAVWLPRAVPVDWAPYRAGHWSWISPWGWTWIDDAPWGFAPFHYGRWAQIGPRWAWVPGRPGPRPVYAPALVAFVGGGSGGTSWNISVGAGRPPAPGLGWFPLAPGEAYRPAYRASPRYVTQVNNNIVVNNVVNNYQVYRYQRQPSAVTVVNAADFAYGRPGRGSFQAVNASDLGRAPVITNPAAGPAALPPGPERRDLPTAAVAAAVPPAAMLTPRMVVASQADRREGRHDERREVAREDRGNDPRARPEGREWQRPAAWVATAPAPHAANAPVPGVMPGQPLAAVKPAPGVVPATPLAAVPVPVPAAPTRPVQVQPAQQTSQAAVLNPPRREPMGQSDQARRFLNIGHPPEAQREQPQRPAAQPRVISLAPTPLEPVTPVRLARPVRPVAPPVNSQVIAEPNTAELAKRTAAGAQEQSRQQAQHDAQREQQHQHQQQDQARHAQKAQQDQARQQQLVQQDQQRQAREQQVQQQRQQQQQHAQQARAQQPAPGAEAPKLREPRTEGAPHRTREP